MAILCLALHPIAITIGAWSKKTAELEGRIRLEEEAQAAQEAAEEAAAENPSHHRVAAAEEAAQHRRRYRCGGECLRTGERVQQGGNEQFS
jgi:hypothetical protein